MTSAAATVAPPGREEGRSRSWLPPAPVLAAFLTSRVLIYGTFAALVVVRRRGLAELVQLWDGGWYEHIATLGFTSGADGKTGLPFFPFLPGTLHLAAWAGIPLWFAGALVVNVAFGAGLWGLHVLMRRDRDEAAAAASVWCLALFGYGVAFALVYPDAIVLAASVWAFVLVSHERPSRGADMGAALLCAVAACTRPNGILVTVAIGFAIVWNQRQWLRAVLVCLPSVLAVGAWMLQLWVWTRDPLVFMTAKAGWNEVTVLSLLDHGDWNLRLHLGATIVAIAVVVWQRRKLEAAWLVLAGTYLIPSLGLGIVGLGRYTNSTFPVFAAAGEAVAPLPRALRLSIYTAGAALTVAITYKVLTSSGWVP